MRTVTQGLLREQLADEARSLGFDDIGFCSVDPFEQWLEHAYNPLVKRIAHDPRVLMAEARTILIAVKRYEVFGSWPDGSAEVAHYYLNSNTGFADIKKLGSVLTRSGWQAMVSPSLPAKQAAVRAGLGVQGMNTQFCHNEFGTLVSLHMILTDAPLAEGDSPYTTCALCGSCAAACPTGAVNERGFDHQKCLRFHMASGSVVPMWARVQMGMRLIGCTDCQHSCPHALLHVVEVPVGLITATEIGGLLRGDYDQIERLGSYIGKNFAHPKRIRQQAAICAGNSGSPELVPLLSALLNEEDVVLRSHAAWALGRLGGPEAREALLAARLAEQDGAVIEEINLAMDMICE